MGGLIPSLLIPSSGEDAHHKHPTGRMSIQNQIHNGLSASKDFFSGVGRGKMTIIGIVRSNEQHERLGGDLKIQLTLLKIPQDLLRAIAIEPQVDRIQGGENLIPNRLEGGILAVEFPQTVGDGISNQHQIMTTLPHGFHFLSMP